MEDRNRSGGPLMRMRSWVQFYLRTAFPTSRNRVAPVPDTGFRVPGSGLRVRRLSL